MKICCSLVLLCLLIFPVASQASADSTEYKIIRLNFKIGAQSNYLLENDDFRSGHTGWGFFLEVHPTPAFSTMLSASSLHIRTLTGASRLIEFDELNKREYSFKFRYRWMHPGFSLFPEVGIGSWGKEVGLFILGAGAEAGLTGHIYLTGTFDYNYLCDRCLDVGGGGWSGSVFRLNVGISYFFNLRLKGGPVNGK